MCRVGSGLALCIGLLAFLGTRSASAPSAFLQSFPLSAVQLQKGSAFDRQADLATQYLLSLEPGSLLYSYRVTANLDTDSAQPYTGSWEDPACEIRGEMAGHWLSATARVYNNTGNAAIRERMELVVIELKKVQDAVGTGYLSAFPTEHFDRVEGLLPVWAPYYVIHKILAGLVDQYQLAGSQIALNIAKGLAAYHLQRIDHSIKVNGTAHWQKVLETEFGGMQEAAFLLYQITQDPEHERLANFFVKAVFAEPVTAGVDTLENLHANTHLAQVNGFAAKYEVTADKASLNAVQNFFHILTSSHSYPTGGSNIQEYWHAADAVGDAVTSPMSTETQETCTQYNILKLARYLFRWSGDVQFADYYEKALLNGIIGAQRLADGIEHTHGHHRSLSAANARVEPQAASHEVNHVALHRRAIAADSVFAPTNWFGLHVQDPEGAVHTPGTPGVFVYLTPLGAGNAKGDSSHHWGFPLHSFWCCYGTAMESFAKLADSIYFWRPASGKKAMELYVNQLVSSTLTWEELGVTLQLEATHHGPQNTAVACLHVVSAKMAPVALHIKVRIPSWAAPDGIEVKLNSHPYKGCANSKPGSYCSVESRFRPGDRIDVKLPILIHTEPVQDKRPEMQKLQAIMMGPFVMAGLTHDTRRLVADPAQIHKAVTDVPPVAELVSISLQNVDDVFLRHDKYHVFMSHLDDGGDAVDATFRLVDGLAGRLQGSGVGAAGALSAQRQLQAAKAGSHDRIVSLESMNLPGFYIGHDPQGHMVLERPSGQPAFAAAHSFVVRRGLDSSAGSVSLELLDHPAFFLSAYNQQEPAALTCQDQELCSALPKATKCTDDPAVALVQCKRSCGQCGVVGKTVMALSAPGNVDDTTFAHASTFRLVKAQGKYPQGSRMVHGQDRDYIIAPLGNLIDERYTAMFEFVPPSAGWEAMLSGIQRSALRWTDVKGIEIGAPSTSFNSATASFLVLWLSGITCVLYGAVQAVKRVTRKYPINERLWRKRV